jgi:hypothetical protein
MMSTLSEAIAHFEGEGFTERFGVRGNQLLGFESGTRFGAHEVVIRGFDRFEGISDPDDMAIEYTSPSRLTGARGDRSGARGGSHEGRGDRPHLAPQFWFHSGSNAGRRRATRAGAAHGSCVRLPGFTSSCVWEGSAGGSLRISCSATELPRRSPEFTTTSPTATARPVPGFPITVPIMSAHRPLSLGIHRE